MIVLEHLGDMVMARTPEYPRETFHTNVAIKRTMSGYIRTHIKSPTRSTFEFTVELDSIAHSDEFRSFLINNHGSQIKCTFNDDTWNVRILNDTFEFQYANNSRTLTLRLQDADS